MTVFCPMQKRATCVLHLICAREGAHYRRGPASGASSA